MTIGLISTSWRVLRADPRLLLLVLAPQVLTVGVFGSPGFHLLFGASRLDLLEDLTGLSGASLDAVSAVLALPVALTSGYLAALMCVGVLRSVAGMAYSWRETVAPVHRRLPVLLLWAALHFGVLHLPGAVLHVAHERWLLPLLSLAVLGWRLVTFAVMPALIVERVSLAKAVARSMWLFRSIWLRFILIQAFVAGLVFLAGACIVAVTAVVVVLVGNGPIDIGYVHVPVLIFVFAIPSVISVVAYAAAVEQERSFAMAHTQ